MLNVDDVMIGEPVPDATVPEVNVVPDVNSAFVTWTSENAVAYDLRYRPYVDTSLGPTSLIASGICATERLLLVTSISGTLRKYRHPTMPCPVAGLPLTLMVMATLGIT